MTSGHRWDKLHQTFSWRDLHWTSLDPQIPLFHANKCDSYLSFDSLFCMGTRKKKSNKRTCNGNIDCGDADSEVCSAKRTGAIVQKVAISILCTSRNHVVFVFTFAVPNNYGGITWQIISYRSIIIALTFCAHCFTQTDGWRNWIQGSAAHYSKWIWFPFRFSWAVSHHCNWLQGSRTMQYFVKQVRHSCKY